MKKLTLRARGPPPDRFTRLTKNDLEEILMKIIKIKDYYGNYQEVPVEDSLYEEWVKLNNDDQRIYRREMPACMKLSLS